MVVGIAASGRGLEAFTTLLRFLPANSGLAIIVVQHPDPDQESLRLQMLSRATPMKVLEARHGTKPAPDRVYIIPPGRMMTISGGRLRLEARLKKVSRHQVIDTFFVSLARDLGRQALGIVLSGNGGDGAAGLEAIRAGGGITFSQDEGSARQSGMPQSAGTSCVDFVLPPERIAAELVRLAHHGYWLGSMLDDADIDENIFRKITLALRDATAVDFSGYRQSTIVPRIRRRMAVHQIETLEAYLGRLQGDPAEARALYEDILIHVTKFFSDEEAFQAIKERIAPFLMASSAAADPIRVWVPGCSTGEEVYSIAILLHESRAEGARPAVQLFGTDLNERAIERARTAVYADATVAGMPLERLNRFFVRVNGGYQISKVVREMCVFARHDMTGDPPFSNLDFISCRNVLTTMGSDLQRRVIETFHHALKPNGRLMLGKSESPGANSDLFTLEDRKNRIYRHKSSPPRFKSRGKETKSLSQVQSDLQRQEAPLFDLTKNIEGLLALRYLPPAVLVDSGLQILQFHGDTSPFLKPANGRAELHLLKMVRKEIGVSLRTLLNRARKESARVAKAGVRFPWGDQMIEISLEVLPVKGRLASQDDYLVVFLQPGPGPVKAAPTATRGAKRRENLKTKRLRQELSATQELLQSAREELTTLNEELQVRNAGLTQWNNDWNNLLWNVHIPIVILGPDSSIRHFAPSAGPLFNLTPGDVGRRMSDIQPNFQGVDFPGLISSVMHAGTPLEREVQDRFGLWHSLRIQPYRSGHRVDGALIAAFDVDRIKRSLEGSQLARVYAAAVVETTHEPLLVLDQQLRIICANSAFCATFQVKPGDVTGQLLFRMGAGEWDIPQLREILSNVLRSGEAAEDVELSHAYPGIGLRTLLLNVRPLPEPAGSPHSILLSLEDVTKRRLSEDALRDSEALFRAVFDSSAQSILGVNKAGEIVSANLLAETMFGYSNAELVGLSIERLMPERFRRNHATFRAGYFASPPRSMGPNLDIFGLRKDGTEFPIEVSLACVPTRRGVLSIAFVDDVSARKATAKAIQETEAALRQSQEHLRRLTSGLFQAQEEERRRISRELHDDLNQRLASLVMEVQTAEQLLPSAAAQARSILISARKHVEQISDGVRRAAYQLHPSILEHLGLVAALKSLCADFQSQHKLKVAFRHHSVPESIPLDAALCLYRVTQESLRNVIKHSGQSTAGVTISCARGIIHLIVEDAGTGLRSEPRSRRAGLGIVSMEERVRLAGGALEIESQAGAGTRVRVSLPVLLPPPSNAGVAE